MKNEQLIKLLKLAQGNRGQNQYARVSDVPSSTLSRYYTGERKPEPEILKKLAQYAHNGVSYEQLMHAAGYLPEPKSASEAEVLSPRMHEAISLIKTVDEKNLDLVIGIIERAVTLQSDIKRKV